MRLLDASAFDDPALIARDPALLAYVRSAVGQIHNLSTRLQLLDTGDELFPLSVNDGHDAPDNSYVVSPLSTYTGYADYELVQLVRPLLAWPLRRLVKLAGWWLQRAQIDRLVQVNNWLLSTNLYPIDGPHDLAGLTALLTRQHPGHAIAFRSLNRRCNAALIDGLLGLGYLAIPSRQVYLVDASEGAASAFLRRSDNRKDARLMAATRYQRVSGEQLEDGDYARLEQLYRQLYIEKYCALNPQFSAAWLRAGQSEGWLKLVALRTPEGRIDGVIGWFAQPHILSTPVVGYDTALPAELGLYRLLTRITIEEAVARRCLLNLSAGVAHFKRQRGAEPEIEYSLVKVDHLPPGRQRAWRVLASLLHRIGVPLMKRLQL